jgi:uncharacterized HAD superfamily protein
MRESRIYIDVDDVLAETTRALALLARERFAKNVDFDEMHTFDLGVSLGLDHKELPRFMDAAHEPDFLSGLAQIEGASDAVRGWHRAGAEIHVVTGRPPSTRATTLAWLDGARIPHQRLDMVDKYDRDQSDAIPRDALLARDYTVVIEDSADMADMMARSGTQQVLLFDRPWNRNVRGLHGRVERVFSWDAIEAAVRGSG